MTVDFRFVPKEFICEFLELYRSLPCLWRTKLPEYQDRVRKKEAIAQLEQKMQQIDPGADCRTVINRIQVFQKTYQKEARKIQQARDAGYDYQPALWYYPYLEFLKDCDAEGKLVECTAVIHQEESFQQPSVVETVYTVPHVTTTVELVAHQTSEHPQQQLEIVHPEYPQQQPVVAVEEQTRTEFCSPKKRRRQKHTVSKQTETVYADTHSPERKRSPIMVTSLEVSRKPMEDRHDAFGRNVAFKLRHMADQQRLLVEKIINDALYEAESGNLNRNCYLYVSNS
ncbi:uncharacterized protein LOC129751655 [Uranotaenia lowii]|uniref:uncharacterized protein LOC129751655 n=1 Tax=Uranotaenia lowii TaxID=190385 RepID=UPI00247A661F|nr:uncharacterized protein LOC129751655 [Uranotaenia lowii]